jgi:hypothetical protein
MIELIREGTFNKVAYLDELEFLWRPVRVGFLLETPIGLEEPRQEACTGSTGSKTATERECLLVQSTPVVYLKSDGEGISLG